MRPELQAFCRKLFGQAKVELARVGNERTLFSIRIAVTPAPALSAVVANLDAAAG